MHAEDHLYPPVTVGDIVELPKAHWDRHRGNERWRSASYQVVALCDAGIWVCPAGIADPARRATKSHLHKGAYRKVER